MFSSITYLVRGAHHLVIMRAILGMLIVGGIVTGVSADVVFRDSFNSGDLSQRYHKHGGCYPYSFVQKNGILRITNRFWEDNRTCSDWTQRKRAGGHYTRRVELMPKPSVVKPLYGREYEWEFDLKVVKAPKGEYVVVFQVISAPWDGYDIALRYEKGNWSIYARKGGVKKSHVKKKIGKVQVGKWTTMTIRFKRSLGSDGYVQLLINHDLKFHHRGPTTISKDPKSMAKFGIYSGQPHNGKNRSEFIMEFDNLTIERH